jgi:hypothetical protein
MFSGPDRLRQAMAAADASAEPEVPGLGRLASLCGLASV